MDTTSILRKLFICLYLGVFSIACDTDDMLPNIELSSSQTSLSEDSGSVQITVTANTTLAKNLTIPIIFSGTATQESDYSLSSSNVIIMAGDSSGSMTISGLQDVLVEGIETLIISIGEVQNVYLLSTTTITIEVLDDDSDSDGDGVLDAIDECPNVAGVSENNGCPWLGFLINEVLYDPASDLTGDANGDGTRDANQDEFIEFFNSGVELDLSGYTVSDASSLRHTFPEGTILAPNGVLVLFGGGTPTGNFGGAIVQTASSGLLNITNSGDVMTLADASGNVVLTFNNTILSGNPDESYTRSPDLTGEFVQHASITESEGRLFSPGTRLDGTPF